MDVKTKRCVDKTPAMERKRSKSASRQRFSAVFVGSTTLDNHFTSSMMPWVLAELRRNPQKDSVTLEIIDGLLITYRAKDGHELFRHSVYNISRFAQTNSDRTSFMYLVNEKSALQSKNKLDLLCFLFKMDNEKSVGDLFMTVKEEKSVSSTPGKYENTPKLSAVPKQMTRSLSLCGDSPPNLSQFYEVLFLGKIQASHKRAPPTFIDDALKKFKLRESNKAKKRRESADDAERSSPEDVEEDIQNAKTRIVQSEEKENLNIQSDPFSHPLKTQDLKLNEDHPLSDAQPTERTLSSNENQTNFIRRSSQEEDGTTSGLIEIECEPAQPRNRSKSITSSNNAVSNSAQDRGLDEKTANRTMLLQIARTDLRLISPDKRQVLLHKSFKEISHCSAGAEFKEHFGFICKEASHDGYVGYVFRCDSSPIVEDIMTGLKSAFQNAHESARKAKANQQCEKCPMVWFNQLCMDMDGLGANKAQAVLWRRMEKLEEPEREDLLAKMQGAETPNIEEQNQILMMLLRANCEVKQQSHEHITVLLPQPPPTPSIDNSAGSLSEAAIKAKRSLATTFNGIMRRKASMADVVENTMVAPPPSIVLEKPTPVKRVHPLSVTNAERRLALEKSVSPEKNPLNPLTPDKHTQFNCEVSSPGGGRRRAGTLGSSGGETMKRELARRSALARRRQEAVQEEKQQDGEISPLSIFMKTTHKLSPATHTPASRHSIFQKVVTPRKSSCTSQEIIKKNEPRNYKQIWQKAIKQQILLNRMERENKKMQETAEILAEKKLKLEYKSLVTSTADLYSLWENLLSRGPARCCRLEVGQAVGRGVPRSRRGEVWQLLVQLQEQRSPPPETDTEKFGQWDQAYSVLKSQLTSHQHSILIDLGRTFPSHAYFSGALGLGQLSLFNLLKAYSILDPEVGYCQGLPFLGGLLLMHLDEEASFCMLKHLMFGLGLRKQFMPDMTGLQVYMYQLTRLLAETQPNLYRQLDRLEVDPSLYATPWFLTLFAAHFPLGFVSRVFDLLFLEGPHAIIKVGVCLMVECAVSMLECDNLEDVMNVIKTDLPGLPAERLEDVIKQANGLNISRQLRTYEVEYHVMQEELSVQATNKAKDMDCLTQANNKLRSENSELLDQVKSKNLIISRLEAEVTFAAQQQLQDQQQLQITENNLLQAQRLIQQLTPLCGSNIPDNIRTVLDELHQSDNGNLPPKR